VIEVGLLIALGLFGEATRVDPPPRPSLLRFVDVTAAAGITFSHESGRVGDKWLPETLGAGVAFFDADADGWIDLFFVNGRKWQRLQGDKPAWPALYLNRGDGTFRDATIGSGLDVELYGMGVAAADYDNDGLQDLYLTAHEGDRLYRNLGGGKFRDVSAAAGIDNRDFGTSAAFFDFDRDGWLDLFVANYVKWRPEIDKHCSLDGVTKSYCTPVAYEGTSSKLYRNLGDGRFADVSAKTGIAQKVGKALGVGVLDFDLDRLPDLFVANDTQPNFLFRNLGDGRFAEVGLEAGVAFDDSGKARGAMGVGVGDYDGSGRPHLLVGNFALEMLGLYRNEGDGLFIDQAPGSEVGRASASALTFGVFFFDADLDGQLDILAANGHLEETITRVQPKIQYRQPPLLLRNLGADPVLKGRFVSISAEVGEDFARPIVGRGAAFADFDRDGDLDVVLTTNHGPPHLLRNDLASGSNWLRVRLVGRISNRDGIGAIVRIKAAGRTQWTEIRSGSSYCSQNELVATFGLAHATAVETVEIEWPSGRKQSLGPTPAGREIIVAEGGP
jgi:enediyne biosynthesis protein E4